MQFPVARLARMQSSFARLGRMQLPPGARAVRPWEVTSNMRTMTDMRKDALPPIVPKDSVVNVRDPAFESGSEISEHAIRVNQSRMGAVSAPPYAVFPKEGEGNARDMKVDIRSLKDEGLNSAALFLRVKSASRLPRQSLEGGTEEKTHLLKDHECSRKSSSEELGNLSGKGQHSFRADVGHAASETFLLTRLAFNLLRYLGVGYRWITRFLALGLYAALLLPGFLRVAYQYTFSKDVHRSIIYGDQPRNRLDMYLPDCSGGSPKPVVIFVTGGAWIIGYKAWGALLGIQLVRRDIIVCCIDYRNFPQGTISDMVEDVSNGISFVVDNIERYGGDPSRIFLGGQSAGSHLAACAIMDQVRIQIGQKGGCLKWKPSSLKAFLGLSGAYNLPSLVDHFDSRGLYRSLFLSVMEGETSLPLYSPESLVRSAAFAEAIPLLPPVHLFHGTGDYSIPYEASVNFGEALRTAGAAVTTKLYPNKTHTDVFLQDPMRGGEDDLYTDLLSVIHAGDEEATVKDAEAPLRPRLVPEFLLRLASKVSPF